MRRRLAASLLVAGLILAVAAPAVLAEHGRGPKVKSKFTVQGIVTAVHPARSMLTVQLTNRGSIQQAGASVLRVLVAAGTEIRLKFEDSEDDEDDEEHERHAVLRELRVGDRVKIEAFRLDDGRVLALKLEARTRRAAGFPRLAGVVAIGVVAEKRIRSLVIVGEEGTWTVLVTPATEFRGQRESFAAIRRGDAVVVRGTVNADGTIVARQVETTFIGGATTIGVITAIVSLPPFLILNNALAINVGGDTRILSGGRVRSFSDLRVGQTVTVTGAPVIVAGVTVAINARVITF